MVKRNNLLKKIGDKFRRAREDRRKWRPLPEVPFLDSDGKQVKDDRRTIEDRRKNNGD